MPGSKTSKPSWWAIFLGRSPPVPPIPSGGWTRESVRDFWRQRIAMSPQDAPLSHADLAKLLRARGWIRNWLWPESFRIKPTVHLLPSSTFEQRLFGVPGILFFAVFPLAWVVFTFVPEARSLYPLLLLSEDTVCVWKASSSSTWRPFSCDALIWATDITLIFLMLSIIPVLLLQYVGGGLSVLRSSQTIKMFLQIGWVGTLLLTWLTLCLAGPVFISFFLLDQGILPLWPFLFALPFIVPLFALSPWIILRLLAANFAIIFFHMTGRFPSWLEDLSP